MDRTEIELEIQRDFDLIMSGSFNNYNIWQDYEQQ